MDFSQYLRDYQNVKRLKGGITPGRRDAVNLFGPYFEKRQAIDYLLKKQQQAEKEQAAKEKQWGAELAWDKEKTLKTLAQEKALKEGGMLTDKEIAQARLASQMELGLAGLASNRDITMAQLASQGDIASNRLATQSNIAMSGLDWDRQRAADNLAYDMWKNSMLMGAAGRQDTNATWSNIFSSLGSIGSGLLLKKYWE